MVFVCLLVLVDVFGFGMFFLVFRGVRFCLFFFLVPFVLLKIVFFG